MDPEDERKARNETIFRDANERIEQVRESLSKVEGRTPYFCECEDAACRDVLYLDLHEYEEVRSLATQFMIVPGHPHTSGGVITDHGRYLIVAKEGEATRIALETDPRRDEDGNG